jgi:hypothetical protein
MAFFVSKNIDVISIFWRDICDRNRLISLLFEEEFIYKTNKFINKRGDNNYIFLKKDGSKLCNLMGIYYLCVEV